MNIVLAAADDGWKGHISASRVFVPGEDCTKEAAEVAFLINGMHAAMHGVNTFPPFFACYGVQLTSQTVVLRVL